MFYSLKVTYYYSKYVCIILYYKTKNHFYFTYIPTILKFWTTNHVSYYNNEIEQQYSVFIRILKR